MTDLPQSHPTTDARPRYIVAGVDETGAHHVYRTTDETILVVHDGRLTHRQPLRDGAHIKEWLLFVGDRRGWADQRLHDTVGETIAAAVEVEA